MKHILNKNGLLTLLAFVLVTASIVSCEKVEPPKYSGENFLYFRNNVANGATFPKDILKVYSPEKEYSSLLTAYQLDTLTTNVHANFPLSVYMDGKVMDKKRRFVLEIAGNGKEYCVAPHPDSLYIPANGTMMKLNLKFVRPPANDLEVKTVVLTLKNSEDFSPENHIWNTVTYNFGNWISQPQYYDNVRMVFGDFSSEKMKAILEAIEIAGSEEWTNDVNVALLNTYFKGRNQRLLSFNPFTSFDFYYLLDNRVGLTGGANGAAYFAILGKMAVLTKALIAERKSEGKPIVDAAGNEISMP